MESNLTVFPLIEGRRERRVVHERPSGERLLPERLPHQVEVAHEHGGDVAHVQAEDGAVALLHASKASELS